MIMVDIGSVDACMEPIAAAKGLIAEIVYGPLRAKLVLACPIN